MSQTIENLVKAFIGESQARNRYNMYAKTAKNEGYVQISDIFTETAEHERQHAKWLFRLINELKTDNNPIIVEADCGTDLGTTEENLQAAINGEHHETASMYPEFADIAEKEGHQKIAVRLRAIGRAEAHHEERYQKLLDLVKADKIFKKDTPVLWTCMECGYVHEGEEPPVKCPACDHPSKYYKVLSEEY